LPHTGDRAPREKERVIGYHHSVYNSHILPLSSRFYLSSGSTSSSPEKRPCLFSVHLLHLCLRVRFPQPPPYRRVHVIARGPLFLIDDLNFRIYFGSRFVCSMCPRIFSFSLSLSRSLFLSVISLGNLPARVIVVALPRETVVLLSAPPKRFERKGRRRAERMILKYLSPCINLKAAGAHT